MYIHVRVPVQMCLQRSCRASSRVERELGARRGAAAEQQQRDKPVSQEPRGSGGFLLEEKKKLKGNELKEGKIGSVRVEPENNSVRANRAQPDKGVCEKRCSSCGG